ncbi:MAG: hypothetical protein DRR42_24460 [Gammaproteobacteria bacterium]|nr:MAG: hypothetical protein DRR42_24460 [Gammaproteobacteria bacterium]
MRILNKLTSILPAAAVLALMSPQVVIADEIVTCKSRDYEFQHCDAKSSPKHVKLHKQLSKTDCQQGRNWDYDNHGLWVDEGCKGEFLVETGGKQNRHDDSRSKKKHKVETMYGIKITRNIKRNSADYKSFNAGSLKKCARVCSADDRCDSFNFGKENKDCHLKDNVVNGVKNKTVISGVKN